MPREVLIRTLRHGRAIASLCFSALLANAAWAQVPFPPPALEAAQSIEAAVAAVGAGRPEFSSYLLLGVPEISLAGPVKAVVRSELPGTFVMIVLRQYPQVPGAQGAARRETRPTLGKPQATTAARPTVLVAAKRFEPGEAPELTAEFDFQRDERFTLLAFAQGRWFATTREIKLAKPVDDRP